MSSKRKNYLIFSEGKFELVDTASFPDTLSALQTLAGGYIGHLPHPWFDQAGFDIWFDDEAKINPVGYDELGSPVFKKVNLILADGDRQVRDVVLGTIIFTRTNEDGDTLPLRTGDAQKLQDYFLQEHFRLGNCLINEADGRQYFPLVLQY